MRNNPVQGNRVQFAQLASGALVTDLWQTLLRSTDPDVGFWHVVLSPVFRPAVGPTSEDGPANGATGFPTVRMTFGGGGVTYRALFNYPANGAAFAVAGDNITLEVRPQDGATIFTPQSVPAVQGYAVPFSGPLDRPLVSGASDQPSPFASGPVAAFARALLVYTTAAGATADVVFTGPLGVTVTAHLPAGASPRRVEVPVNCNFFSVTTSAGNVAVAQELCFT